MNERLEKIWDQARVEVEHTDPKSWKIVDVREKFAELIIKECIKTLEFHGFDDSIPYIEWMAKNHFDVKL